MILELLDLVERVKFQMKLKNFLKKILLISSILISHLMLKINF